MNTLTLQKQLKVYGERLRRMRIQRGYTLEGLGSVVNASKQTLSNIERAKYKSYDANLVRSLARNLSCTVDYLLGLSEDPQKMVNVDGVEMCNPIEYTSPAVMLKNRLFDLCGNDIALLSLMVEYLEIVTPKQRAIFEKFMNSFVELAKETQTQS